MIVGFIGLGNIGRPIAERILRCGHTAVVCDLNRMATENLPGRAIVVDSPKELASRTDVVFGCIASVEGYRAAILDDDGIITGGGAKTYVHLGTTGPELVEEIAKILAARGILCLDAPVTGGVAKARTGELTSMVSGSSAAYQALHPLIETYSTKIVHLGPVPGLAQTMKLLNNMLSLSALAISAEVLVLGAKAGLSPEMMLDVINSGTGRNSATLTKIPEAILTRAFDCGSALASAIKDLDAYRRETGRSGMPSDLCEAVLRAYRRAAEQGSGSDDISTVVLPFERLADIQVKATAKSRTSG
jgi:3-hydroxyisobutyrate dehydrogenase-like beta-hydroxyacid dehydrogenase